MNKKPRALMLAVIGAFTLLYVLRSVLDGVINLGGRSGAVMIQFNDSPALFVIGLLVIALLGAGVMIIAWRDWRAPHPHD